jgi:group I intron endonuclease
MIMDRNIALQKRPFLVRPAVVYMITNVINGKKYIGVTCQKLYRRKCSHFCDAKNGKDGILGRAIRLYGKENFKCEVIMECVSFEDALLEEIRLIKELKPEYNATKGGDGSTSQLIELCLRKRHRQTVRGLKFSYIEEVAS